MKKYSLQLKDVFGTIWIKAERYEVSIVDDAFGNPSLRLSFYIGEFQVLYLYTYMIKSFKYWPVLSDPKEIEL